MIRASRRLVCSCLLLAAPSLCKAEDNPAEAKRPVDYTAHVRPILAKHCFNCHGSETQESGLRLDRVGFALSGGDRGPAVVAGKSGESLLYQVLVGEGDVSQMPSEGPPLDPEQIALIKHWIDQGAKAPAAELTLDQLRRESDHWSFQPIRRHPVPPVKQTGWVRNAIDAFVLAPLEAKGIAPSPAADRATLIRRLSLDLRGIPPSVEEIDQFVGDERPGAYDRLVDRMLASPQYGERWGRHWLDIARYADSNGFTIDGPRNIWKYRDWVIDAFNRDLPFDQFTLEQLAGDMLPDATTEQIVATGFHRNTLINQEGGTDQEQFRVDAVADRVETTGMVFLGLTVGCARCHEHKYDPISQREFYELFAILNNCDEPTMRVPSSEQTAELNRLTAAIAEAEKPLAEHDAEFLKGLPEWESKIASLGNGSWTVLTPVEMSTAEGAVLNEQPDKSIFVDFSAPPADVYTVVVDTELPSVTAVRLEALTHSNLPMNGPGYADNGNFVLNEFELSAAPRNPAGDPAEPKPIKLASAVADHSQESYPVADAIDGEPKSGWAINVKKGNPNVNREAIFFPAEPIHSDTGTRLVVRMHQNHGSKYLLGHFRLSVSDAPPEALSVPAAIRTIAAVERDKRTKEQQAQLEAAYKQTDTTRTELAQRVDRLKRQKEAVDKAVPTTLVMRHRAEPRETHIHIRGDFLRNGAKVTGDVPDVLPPFPEDVEQPTRIDLARWLTSPSNPLTARVTVNRFWQRFFGRGFVDTENDFGTQGGDPTHPELLDWLADEFMRRNWSIKSLHRLIVTSATYRQSSHVRPELQGRDPDNRLLARQSRLRLEAESIRDVCLATGGLLTESIGGPSVYPPQPEGIYVLTQVKKAWPESKGADRYRRGMYTYFWRSSPYPFLMTFDAPDANTTCTRRPRSNTPLQALTLANDRAFFEIAQALAVRILKEGPDYDEGRIRHGFRVCLTREPNEIELARLTEFLEQQRKLFAEDAEAAKQAAPADRPGNVSTAEAAAWTAVSRVLLNLDELITRE